MGVLLLVVAAKFVVSLDFARGRSGEGSATSASASISTRAAPSADSATQPATINGRWKLVRGEVHPITKQLVKSVLSISGEGDTRTVVWTSELDGYVEHSIVLRRSSGGFTGDYYGGRGNVVISAAGGGRLSLTIDPFAEFEPIRNSIFENVLSDGSGTATGSAAENSADGVTATSGSPAAITAIRAVFAEVQGGTTRFRKTVHEIHGFPARGRHLNGFYDGANLRKLAVQQFEEAWRGTEEYFFAQGQLVFIYVVRERKAEPSGSRSQARLEYRFYFQNGQLIRRIRTQLPPHLSEDLSSLDPKLADLLTSSRVFAECASATETDARACMEPAR